MTFRLTCEKASLRPTSSFSFLMARTPRPPREPRQRVILSREETRSTLVLTDRERQAGYALALYGVIALTLVLFRGGVTHTEKLQFVIVAALGILFPIVVSKGNRLWAGIAAMAWLIGPWQRVILAAYPFLIFWLWTFLKSQSARRKLTEAKAASGDYGKSRPTASASRSKRNQETVKVDSTGRTIAEPSRRYTPPKKR